MGRDALAAALAALTVLGGACAANPDSATMDDPVGSVVHGVDTATARFSLVPAVQLVSAGIGAASRRPPSIGPASSGVLAASGSPASAIPASRSAGPVS